MSPIRLVAVMEACSITGPAKNLLEFARLAKPGVETGIVTFVRGEQSNPFIETARAQGIAVETIRERGVCDPAAMQALPEAVRKLAPDVVQTHAVKSHFLARSTGLERIAPWVAFHHGYTSTSMRTRLYNQLDRWSLTAARRVVTVSGPFRDALIRKGVPRERIEIVHNAIAHDWEAARRTPEEALKLRSELGIPEQKPVILIVGRLSEEKDHLTLIEAVAALRERVEMHLMVVGEGPERPRIERRVAELGLRQQVTLTGHKNSSAPYYGIANVAVLSSRTEGSPNALLEAMAAGVPVVATAVGGIPEIVTDRESALLVQPGDPKAMTAAIGRLLAESDLRERLSQRARERVVTFHSPEQRVGRICKIYRTLLE